MEYHEHDQAMFEYYDNSPHYHGHDAAGFMEQVRQSPDHWAQPMVADMQEALRGRRVLEVACGYGRWTRFAAEVAAQIVATDFSPHLLSQARHQGLPPEKVEFRMADAYEIEHVEGTFDAGLHMNFFSHVPKARADGFLDALHRKLGPGSVVFMGADQCGEAWMRKIYTKPGSSDIYTLRERPDGLQYEIINNIFNERTLCDILEPRATDLKIRIGKYWWWMSYTIRG